MLLSCSAWAFDCGSPGGDINLNQKLDVVDVQCAIVHTLWQLGPNTPPPACAAGPAALADTNCDAAVNLSDAVLVAKRAVGLSFGPQLDANNDGCVDACELTAEKAAMASSCFGGPLMGMPCADNNPCTLDVCLGGPFGGCVHFARKTGTPCDADGDGCTRFDSCSAGVCVPGAPPNCDDELECTLDICHSLSSAAFQCIHAPLATPCAYEPPVFVDGADFEPTDAGDCTHSIAPLVEPSLKCEGNCGVACDEDVPMTWELPTEAGQSYRLSVKLADTLHDCTDSLRVHLAVEGALGISWILFGEQDWAVREYEFTAVDSSTTVSLTQVFEHCCACDGSCVGGCSPSVGDLDLAVDWLRLEDLEFGGACAPNPLDCEDWEPAESKLKVCEAYEVGTEALDIFACSLAGFCGDLCIENVYDRGSWLRVDMEFCPHGTADPSCTAPSTYRYTYTSTTERVMQVSLVSLYTVDGDVAATARTEKVYDILAGDGSFAVERVYVPSGSSVGQVYLRKPSTSEVASWDRVDVHVLVGEGGVSGAPSTPLYCSEVTLP